MASYRCLAIHWPKPLEQECLTAGSASEPSSLPNISFPEDGACRSSAGVSRNHTKETQLGCTVGHTAMYRDSLERVSVPSPKHRLPKQLRR